MAWEFKDNLPIYTQLIEQITLRIVSGEYKPGEKLPSVRDLAAEAAVNPNTMQRALTELERVGLVYSVRTSGRFITEDCSMIEKMQTNLAKEEIKKFIEKLKLMGFDENRILDVIKNVIEERK